jgi:hypothetical protein
VLEDGKDEVVTYLDVLRYYRLKEMNLQKDYLGVSVLSDLCKSEARWV